jgi:hypothetical protein
LAKSRSQLACPGNDPDTGLGTETACDYAAVIVTVDLNGVRQLGDGLRCELGGSDGQQSDQDEPLRQMALHISHFYVER